MAFNVPGYQDEVYVKKRWKIETNNDVFVAASQHLADPPGNLREVDFVQCRGKIAKQTAQYTPEFAKHFWNTIVPNSRVLVVVKSRCLEMSDQISRADLVEQMRA